MDFAARKLGVENLKSQQVTALHFFGKSHRVMIYLSICPPGSGANVGQKDAVPVDCRRKSSLRIEMVGTVFKILNYIL